MGNKPVQRVNRHLIFFQCLYCKTAQGSDGDLKNFRALHVDLIQVFRNNLRRHRLGRAAGGNMKHLPEGTVGQQVGGKDTMGRCLLRSLDNSGPSPVTKQNAGGAIFPVDDGAQDFGADHQTGFDLSGTDELIGNAQSVNESRTGGIDIHPPGFGSPQLMLKPAGSRWDDGIRRTGGIDDLFDVERGFSGHLQGV